MVEIPAVEDITEGSEVCEEDIRCGEISYAYHDEDEKQQDNMNTKSTDERQVVLRNFTAFFEKNKIHGILGKSGCGKSTLLKLMMRFYETDEGNILYGDKNVNEINTSALRNNISYVTQETFLFSDTIEENIKVAKEDATHEEIVAAAKKASIYLFG